MNKKYNVTILGSTGYIGSKTLDIIRNTNDFNVFALTGFNNIDKLVALCKEFNPKFVVVPDLFKKEKLELLINSINVLISENGLEEVSSMPDVDIVVSAISGFAGLRPTIAAAKAGKKILLANKESLVAAGNLLLHEVIKNNAQLIPIDSEHNAIFQCINSNINCNNYIDQIILTASGGPFKNKKLDELDEITPDQACCHPNWEMGRKISIDSSTMVNKALEVIEAYWLFNVPVNKIIVLIHPQSIIHSMVRYIDGSYLAQLGVHDMKISIANGLYYPNKGKIKVDKINFIKYILTFEEVCLQRFEILDIAFNNLKYKNYSANIILNAANERLVTEFLNYRIKYSKIIPIIKKAIEELHFKNPTNIEEVFEIDKKTREYINYILRND